jgi:hypothetical protein
MSLKNHVDVMRNPFATGTRYAKVCDGAVGKSSTLLSEFRFDTQTHGNDVIYMLEPSFSVPLVTIKNNEPAWDADVRGVMGQVARFKLNGSELLYGTGTGIPNYRDPDALIYAEGEGPVEPDANVDLVSNLPSWDLRRPNLPPGVQPNPLAITNPDQGIFNLVRGLNNPIKARLVSSGLRLSLVNDFRNDAGWFEAIRVRHSYKSSQCVLVPNYQKILARYETCVGIALDFLEPDLVQALQVNNWPNNASYITGPLRDLHKYTFMLQPCGPRDFKDIPFHETTAINVRTDDALDIYGTQVFRLYDYGSQHFGFDNSFDTVMVRVSHVRIGDPALQRSQAINVHCKSHYEVLYGGTSPLQKMHTSCINAPSAVKNVDKSLTKIVKAGIMLS